MASTAPRGSAAWLASLAVMSLGGLLVLTFHALAAAFGSPSPVDDEQAALASSAPDATSTTVVPSTCEARSAVVANTHPYDGAKLRSGPGFDSPQDGYIPEGEALTVCASPQGPGQQRPNQWYQVAAGSQAGKWIHSDVLRFEP
jgi:uncharacterized protein YgiM (DUF1202 family)